MLPSGAWRTAVGLGVPLGWSETQLQRQSIPGSGTAYVLGLTVVSVAAAALTLGLVQRWGETVPGRVLVIGGRRPPTSLVAGAALLGAAIVAALVALSIVHWSSVSGFADRPTSGWALLMAGCYAPAVLWPVLLTAVTVAYVRRRRAGPDAPAGTIPPATSGDL